MFKRITSIMAIVLMASTLVACGGNPVVDPDPIPTPVVTPTPAAELSITWLGTVPPAESTVAYDDWNISTRVSCNVPAKYTGYVTCSAIPSVDGINPAGVAKSTLWEAPLSGKMVSSDSMIPSSGGIKRTEFLILQIGQFPDKDPNNKIIIAKGEPVRWPLNYK